MTHKKLALALGMIAVTLPVSATSLKPTPGTPAPSAGANARYCLRIEAVTGSRIETIRCWTREEWAAQGVDVDAEWAKEGVQVIG